MRFVTIKLLSFAVLALLGALFGSPHGCHGLSTEVDEPVAIADGPGFASDIDGQGNGEGAALEFSGGPDPGGFLSDLSDTMGDFRDIENLLNQLASELGRLNFTDILQEVFAEVQPVLDAVTECASKAPELVEPAQTCVDGLISFVGDLDVGLGGDMEGDVSLRRLLHGGRRGIYWQDELQPATGLCTTECTEYLKKVANLCPSLAGLVLNDTSVEDACSGVEPGFSGEPLPIIEPLPNEPAADTAEEPADLEPMLIGGDQQEIGSAASVIAGAPSSAGPATIGAVWLVVSACLVWGFF